MFKAGWSFESGTVEGWAILSGSNGPSVSAVNPKTGGYALAPGAGTYIYAPIGESLSDAIVQFCASHAGNFDQLRFGLLYGGTWVAYVQFNGLRQPTLYYNGGAASQGPLTDFDLAETDYHTIEIEMTTIGAAGDIYLRIDGDVLIQAENVDTRAGGGSITQVNQVGHFNPFASTLADVDDVVVFDHSGTMNNSWPDGLGAYPREVEADGTHEEWDASSGTDHAALVSDFSNATYIQTGTASEQDSFAMDDVTGMITGAYDIAAFQVCIVAHEPNGPSARTLDPFLIVDTVEHQDGVDHTLTATADFYPGKLWEENPETDLPWTAGDLDDIEIGITSGA